MNAFRNRRVERGARQDAAHTVESAEARVMRELGPRPAFDPVGNHQHALVNDDLLLFPEINELRGDLAAKEDERGQHHPLWLFRLLILAAIAVDALGGCLVMRSLDIPEEERWPLGIALAFFLILLTSAVAKSASRAPNSSRWKSLLIPLVYGLLVLSVAVIRLSAVEADVSRAELLAEATIMLATSLGPPFFVEHLYHRFAPARVLDADIKNLRQRLAERERRFRKAQRFMTRLAERQAAWDKAAAQMRAAYLVEFRLAEKDNERALPPATSSPPQERS